MKIYNKYIVSLVVVSYLINTLLAFLGVNDLEIYFTINLIAYLVITLLYVYLNPRVRRALNVITAVLAGGFVVIVTFKVIEIVAG